jgi:hypothetical protein
MLGESCVGNQSQGLHSVGRSGNFFMSKYFSTLNFCLQDKCFHHSDSLQKLRAHVEAIELIRHLISVSGVQNLFFLGC